MLNKFQLGSRNLVRFCAQFRGLRENSNIYSRDEILSELCVVSITLLIFWIHNWILTNCILILSESSSISWLWSDVWIKRFKKLFYWNIFFFQENLWGTEKTDEEEKEPAEEEVEDEGLEAESLLPTIESKSDIAKSESAGPSPRRSVSSFSVLDDFKDLDKEELISTAIEPLEESSTMKE